MLSDNLAGGGGERMGGEDGEGGGVAGEVQEGGDVCILTADSHSRCCMAEVNTIL